jgi:hypothetical protein
LEDICIREVSLNLIIYLSGYKRDIAELAVSKFCEIVKHWEKPTKARFFYQCIENIKNVIVIINSFSMYLHTSV